MAGVDTYEFGSFRLESWPARLLRDGQPVPLTPKALKTLLVLVRNHGHLVSKDRLLEAVWPGVHVEEVGLARNVSVLRKALGSGKEDRRFIETIPRQGYRFVGGVTRIGGGIPSDLGSGPTPVAVLPLKNMSPEQDEGYLGLGIADALIARLSQLRQIIVRPTGAVRLYGSPGQDPIAAGRALRVEWVLDGCLQLSHDRVRVTLQIVRVQDGAALWTAKYDERLTDIFALEDSIADRLVDVLAVRLTAEDQSLLARRDTGSAEAHHHYLKGRYHWNRRTEEGMRRAIACFNEAIAADPSYALAYAGLSDAYTLLGSIAYGGFRPSDVWPRARAAALQALALDDRLAEARTSLAFIRFRYDWDWEGAERDFAAAIALNPHYATARQWHAYLLSTWGRHEDALSEIRCAQELDPLSLPIATGVGRFLYFAGRYEEATRECRKAVEMDETFAGAHLDLGIVYVQLGRYREAVSELRRVLELSGGSPPALAHLGHAYGVSGQHDKAREVLSELRRLSVQAHVAPSDWAVYQLGVGNAAEALACLERAYEARDSFMVLLKVEPLLAPLRTEPRFLELLRRLGHLEP
jgi:DNA-binding winged helix-turn-helix (wHTH) protein/tetratricopeptide (TPR) repeat protein